jgi:hypothetical protein
MIRTVFDLSNALSVKRASRPAARVHAFPPEPVPPEN